MSDTDYDALIEGGALDPASSAKSSLNVGSWSNPDEEARLQSLAKKSGVPVEALRETAPEVEKKLQVDSVDYDALFEQSPTVGSWLSDVRNAQIAHDDVQNLSKIERAWNLTKDAWTSFRFSPIGQMGGLGMQGLAAMGEAAGRTVARATGTADEFALLDRAFGDYDEKVLGFLFPQEQIGQTIERFAKEQNIPEERQNFVTDTAGAVGGVVGQILLPGAGTALMAAAESEQLQRRAEKAGTAGTAGADAAILLGGVASYGLEKLGLDAILRRLPPKLRNKALRHGSDLLLAGGGEGITEGLQSAASDVLTKTLIDEEHQMFESVGYEAGVGFTTGAIVRGVLNTIAPGRLQFSEDAQKAAQAIQTGDRLENLVKEIQAAKLPTRSPEAFEDLVSRMTAQGNEEVGVPIEVLRTYAQSQNYAPEALVAELTGGTGAYVEAAMTGGDVRIPTGKFLASKHAPALVRDTRLRPESLTSNEAQQWGDNDANGELKALMSTLKKQSDENGPAIQSAKKIYDDIYNQAIGAGVQDTLAAVVARTQQARYLARAQRLSEGTGKEIDPYDLFKQEVLRIGNEPAPEGMTYESRGGAMEFLKQKFNDPLVESYVAMLDPEESFLYNRTTSEDLDEVVETVLGGAGIESSVEEITSAKSRGVQKLFVIDTNQKTDEEGVQRSTTVTLTNKNEVFINISDNEPGANGSAIYQAVANWAYNNGYKFIEDPSGLSEKSIWRRPENMLSSVLRFGDSRHVDSGLMMALPGMKGQEDATPIQFTGNQGEDARQLIEATARNVRQKLPSVATMSYDFETGAFTKQDGTRLTDEDVRALVQQQGDNVLFGPNSIKRAIISQSLMAKEKELGPEGLRKLASKSAKGKSLPKVFYQGAPMFYSAVQRAVNSAGMKKAPLKQWMQTLANAPGIKQEELEDLGLTDLGKLFPDQTFTKEQLLAIINTNVLRVDEVERFKREGGARGALDALREPRHPQYVEPGGSNYRELVLTLPHQIKPYKPDNFHFTEEGGGTAIAWVRFNERTDADGKKVLFIEEIQSKRHQDAREKGYEKDKPQPVTKLPEGWSFEIDRDQGVVVLRQGRAFAGSRTLQQWETDADAEAKAVETYNNWVLNKEGDGVPNAPMKKTSTWSQLAMKRMIRYAVDNGFDRVAWTTGATQNKRWALSQAVDSIEVFPYKRPDGTVKFNVDFTSKGRGSDSVSVLGDGTMINGNDMLFGQSIANKKLEDVVGRELAAKIMSVTEQTKLSGADLEIGGEGMRSFYDKMLVNDTNKYIKKFGAKVELSKIGADKEGSSVGPTGVDGRPFSPVVHLRPFDENDWDAFAAANVFENGEDPLIAYLNGGSTAVIVDGESIAVLKDVNEVSPNASFKHDFADPPEGSEQAIDEFVELYANAPALKESLGDGIPRAGFQAHIFDVTDKMREAVLQGQPLYQKPAAANQPRGQVQFGSQGERIITLFAQANESTLLHELGHTWLEELHADANGPNATEQLKQDWATVAKWFADNGHAIPPDGAIPVEAHELWARGIERYFMEGKSPSKELNSVFFLFRRWLLRIYQAVSALRTPINKDIRAVFDRLIATDEAIAKSRLKIARRATFAKAADMGVSEEVFAAYERAQQEAAESEQSAAEQEALSEVITQQEEEYRNALAANRERLRKEYEQKPEYRAIKWLRTGELPDGSTIPDVAHARLDAAAVKRMYPNDELFVQRVRRAGLYSMQGGLDPEMVAPLFGYDSADQMLRALVAAPRMMQAVRDEAERITRLEFGDSLLDFERRMNIAMEAVHSDSAGRLLRAELLALRKLQRDSAPLRKQAKAEQKAKDDAKIESLKSDNLALRAALSSEKKERAYERRWMDAERNTEESDARQMLSQIPTVKQMRDTARQIIANSTVRSINREEILRNERAASRKSFEAAAKKDYQEAFTAKVQQLLNHYLYLEASRALEQVAKTQRFAKSLTTSKSQERLGKAGSDYQEQINSLLEQYEFKAASGKQVARRASLLEWVEKQRADGNEVLISPELLVDARKINFKDLTFGELSDLHEALQNINRLASLKNKLLKGRAKVEYEATISELLQELRESLTTDRPPPDDRNTINLLGRIGEGFQEFDATLLKAEQVLRWFSKDDPNGVWMQTIFEPIANAQSAEMDLQKDFTVKLTQLFDNFYKNRGRGVLMEQQLVPLLNQNYTLNAALAAALNTGNEANKEKLLKGRNWSEAQLDQLLSRLTKQDWDFVQSVWDLMSELWPQVSALQSRLTGVAPPKVEAIPVNTPFGVYNGGYYPLVGDSRVSEIGEKQEFDAGNKLYEPGHVKATTSQGHTKARTKAIYPLLLDISVVPQHMSQVIHDLTHREAILNASKILNDSRIRAEITNRMGLPYYKGLRAWLKSVANSSNVDQNGAVWWNKFLGRLRMNANIVAMGFKVTTTFANLGGYVQAIEQVSPQRMAWAMKHFYKNPMRAIREVQAKSGEMRNRSNSIERDIFENYNKNLGKSGPLTWVHRHAFIGISFVDAMISTPTWMGAYADAVQQGKTEEEAIAYADSTVRTTQSAGGVKDLAAVQRGNEIIKFLTMFYSYFNMVYNRMRSLGKTPKVGAAKFAQVAWRSTLLVVIPPLLNEFLAGRGIPDDEEDEPYWWAAKKVALYPMMTVPLLRDVAGTLDTGFESRTPVGAFGKALVDLVRKTVDVAQGERDPEELAKPAMSAAGYAFGLPAGQINITGGYLWDLAVGEEVPESAAEVTKNLMFRREE